MRKIAFCSLAALALVLSACPPRVVEVEVTRIVEVTPAPKVVKLVAWTIGPDEPSYYRRDNLLTAVERLNADFALAGAPLKIELEATFDTGKWGDYKSKFMMAAEAKEAPDIILSGHEDVAAWSDAGFIIPLDDYIKKYWESTYQDIIPGLWPACTYKGVKWAIPQDTEARPMYFSKPLLRKLGWSDAEIADLPRKVRAGEFTLYDLLEVAKEAQDKGVVEPGYGYWTRPKKGGDFYAVYFAFGGQMQDPETGKLVLVKDAFLKHLKFHYDTVFTYKTTPEGFIGTDWKVWHETVSAADKVLFWNGGTWHWAEWTIKYLEGREEHLWANVGFSLFPAGEPGLPPVELSHPLVYMISADCKEPELAFRILTEATTADLNSRHSVESAHLAILLSQPGHPKYAEAPFLKETAYMVEYAVFQPNHPRFGEYDTILWTALSAVMAGEATPEDALKITIDDLKATLGDEVIIK
jgi:inositol-phosphate transport system substrate-binding protein